MLDKNKINEIINNTNDSKKINELKYVKDLIDAEVSFDVVKSFSNYIEKDDYIIDYIGEYVKVIVISNDARDPLYLIYIKDYDF